MATVLPNYRVRGTGPALVLLHGFLQDLRAWDRIVARLEQRYSTIAIDLRGSGQTGLALGIPTPEAIVADIANVLDAEGFGAASLWGYSMGGRLALKFALDRPKRVRALILESTTAGIEDPQQRASRAEGDREAAERLEREPIEKFVALWETMPIFEGQSPAYVAAQREIRLAQDPLAVAAGLRLVGQGATEPLWDRLPALTRPVQLIVGGNDARYLAEARAISRLLPDSRVEVVADVGHAAHGQDPERVAALADQFLRGLAPQR